MTGPDDTGPEDTGSDDTAGARRDADASAELDDWLSVESDTHGFAGRPDPDVPGPLGRTASMMSARGILRSDDDAASAPELESMVQRAMAAEPSRGTSRTHGATEHNDTAHPGSGPSASAPATPGHTRGPAMRRIAAAAASIVVVLGIGTAVLNGFSGGSADHSAGDSATSQAAETESGQRAGEPTNDESPTDSGSTGDDSGSPAGAGRSVFAGTHGSGTIQLN